MSRRRKVLFFAVLVLQLFSLLGMIARKQYTLRGEVVRLKLVPVDPRDLFRGDYLVLAYEFSRPPANRGWQDGEEGYVLIEQGQPYARTGAFIQGLPGADRLFLRCRINQAARGVECGIESFFVPEGSGWLPWQTGDRMAAEVAIDRYGHGVVKRILRDGQPIEFRRKR